MQMWFLGPTFQASDAGWRRSYAGWGLRHRFRRWRHPTRYLDSVRFVAAVHKFGNGALCSRNEPSFSSNNPLFSSSTWTADRTCSNPNTKQTRGNCFGVEAAVLRFVGCWTCWHFFHCSADCWLWRCLDSLLKDLSNFHSRLVQELCV